MLAHLQVAQILSPTFKDTFYHTKILMMVLTFLFSLAKVDEDELGYWQGFV